MGVISVLPASSTPRSTGAEPLNQGTASSTTSAGQDSSTGAKSSFGASMTAAGMAAPRSKDASTGKGTASGSAKTSHDTPEGKKNAERNGSASAQDATVAALLTLPVATPNIPAMPVLLPDAQTGEEADSAPAVAATSGSSATGTVAAAWSEMVAGFEAAAAQTSTGAPAGKTAEAGNETEAAPSPGPAAGAKTVQAAATAQATTSTLPQAGANDAAPTAAFNGANGEGTAVAGVLAATTPHVQAHVPTPNGAEAKPAPKPLVQPTSNTPAASGAAQPAATAVPTTAAGSGEQGSHSNGSRNGGQTTGGGSTQAAASSTANGSGNTAAQPSSFHVPVTAASGAADASAASIPVAAPAANLPAKDAVASDAATPGNAGSLSTQLGSAAAAGAAPVSGAPAINTAHVLQSMNGTEMRVGVHSPEFGAVSISTTFSPGSVAAQISVEHAELTRALATHAAGIEQKLEDKLGVSARVEVRDTNAGGAGTHSRQDGGSSTGQSSTGGGNSRQGAQGQATAGLSNDLSAPWATRLARAGESVGGDGSDRLSVLA